MTLERFRLSRSSAGRLLDEAVARLGWGPFASRLARGTLWSILGFTVARSSLLLSGIVVARLIGKEDFGALGTIQSTVAMVQVFASFGMGLTATKYVAQFRRSDPEKAGRIIAVCGAFTAATSFVMAAVLVLLAPWLAAHVLAAPALVGELRSSAAMLFFASLLGTDMGVLAGFEAFKGMARANLVSAALSLPLVIGGAVVAGLSGTVWGLALATALNWGFIRRELGFQARSASIPVRLTAAEGEWGVIWKFGFPALLAGIVVAPVNWLCAAMLVNRPGGYAEMGLFNAANQWRVAALQLPVLMGQVVTPMLVEQIHTNNHAAVRRLLRVAISTNLILIVPIVVALSAARSFVVGLYGQGFEGAEPVLAILLLTSALMAVQMPAGNVIAAGGRMWAGFFMNLGWGTAAILLTLGAVSHGAIGLAMATCVAYLLHGVWTFAFVHRVLLGRGDWTAQRSSDAP